jgi:hypothetical protein
VISRMGITQNSPRCRVVSVIRGSSLGPLSGGAERNPGLVQARGAEKNESLGCQPPDLAAIRSVPEWGRRT